MRHDEIIKYLILQVINNIRKIPFTSETQLRVSILQYRGAYLEKRVHAIMV
jgi:hypothetical protein